MTPINISVTVPVYNTSRHLKKCLDSLKAQSLNEIEFILVDDGSTDESGKICDEYAAIDSRFRVIHQKNGGSAIARQTGLNAARGEYIIVCDSDDWVEPNMYERLHKEAIRTNADIVMCQFFFEYPDGVSKPHIHLFNTLDGDEFIQEMMTSSINNSSWVKLIRRDLFINGNINYEPGINLGEDSLIIYKLLLLKPKIVQISDILYHYRREAGGNSYTNSLKMSHLHQSKYIHEWMRANYDTNKFRFGFYNKAVNLAFSCLRVDELDLLFYKQHIKNLKWKDFFHFRPTLKSCLVYSCKLLPLRVVKYMFNILYPYFYK
ncbi:glycosyltransferase [uncultured Duncaniella sp.]|uniref:glycosyltransferase family 2 protein n=1 Tax=uncultured Duncaniella sp. TaxID=2768039 RepID=UPI0025A96D72|nr:glycosyltransferase [uncultured Duncaniella sp.]